MYEILNSPIDIGRVTLKNRVAMTAMGTNLAAPEGGVSDDIIAFYEERAKGGIGLIISEITRVMDGHGAGMPNQLALRKPSDAVGMERLMNVIHKYDTKIFVQLQHPGREAGRAMLGEQCVAPSEVMCSVTGEMPRMLSAGECEEIVQNFVRASGLAQMAGADGIELHAAHGYLLGQFLSPHTNRRTDQYGGSFENRMRIVTEIIEGIRKQCGPAFPICVRISVEEFLSDAGRKEGVFYNFRIVRCECVNDVYGVEHARINKLEFEPSADDPWCELAPKRLLGAFLNDNDNYQTASSICYEYRPEETRLLMPHIFNGYDGWMFGDVER